KKSALIDTIEFGSDDNYLSRIDDLLNGKQLDYLVVNHMEPDHSSMIKSVLRKYPQILIIGNTQTYKLLQSFYEIQDENFMQINDGDEIDLGVSKLKFALVPWVHWPETMVTYEITSKTLFSCDAFGGFGTIDGCIFDSGNDFETYYLEDMRRYYSNIVGKYSKMVQNALAKLAGLQIKIIAPSHGLIWKENPGKVIELYDKWSRYQAEDGVVIAYASMYGNTERMADYIGSLFAEHGINVRIHDVSKTHVSYLLSEIWKYKGLVLGTCAYNNQMHPMMEHLCNEIKLSAPKNKILSIFGSSSWNCAGVKQLTKFVEVNDFKITGPILEVSGSPTIEKMENTALEMVEMFVEELKNIK
ncbi:MAG: FprA family A-type flavoprotein, partial [Bacteroidales bacterium]